MRPAARSTRIASIVRLGLTTMFAVFGSLAVSVRADAAAKPCWEGLVSDWSDGAIAGVYPVDCYREALSRLPEDIRLYSSASDDISRALADRVQGTRSVSSARSVGPAATAAATPTSRLRASLVLGTSLVLLLGAVAGAGWYLTHRRRRTRQG